MADYSKKQANIRIARMVFKVHQFLKEELEFMKICNIDNCNLRALIPVKLRTAKATGMCSRSISRCIKQMKNLEMSKKIGRPKENLKKMVGKTKNRDDDNHKKTAKLKNMSRKDKRVNIKSLSTEICNRTTEGKKGTKETACSTKKHSTHTKNQSKSNFKGNALPLKLEKKFIEIEILEPCIQEEKEIDHLRIIGIPTNVKNEIEIEYIPSTPVIHSEQDEKSNLTTTTSENIIQEVDFFNKKQNPLSLSNYVENNDNELDYVVTNMKQEMETDYSDSSSN